MINSDKKKKITVIIDKYNMEFKLLKYNLRY